MENYTITVKGQSKQYPEHITYQQIAQEVQEQYSAKIILALVDGKLVELFRKIEKSGEIDFVTIAEDAGYKTFRRGMSCLMLRSFYFVFGHEAIKQIRVEHSIGNGLYCELDGDVPITKENMCLVKEKMRALVEEDLPFIKQTVSTTEAIKMFRLFGMREKERLFEFRRVSQTNVYSLDGFVDYFYGYMPPSTSYLSHFDLFPYEDGFILLTPSLQEPEIIREFEPRNKLFHILQETNAWGSALNIKNVGALNREITRGNISELILVQEALQEKKIGELAEQIREAGSKFVMIAGPSSSGKTTFSHRLAIQLRTLGFRPHTVAVDNYFVNREQTPLDVYGNYNYECLESIDVEQFNIDMTNLLEGKVVAMPSYNFQEGRREYKGNVLKMGKNDILVIEGIHGLNDVLSYSLDRSCKFKIYISALTQINIDEHNRISTTDGRLIRRMVRDARSRGTSARETIAMWASVRRGEEENIFPFQEDADAMFNSALIYELAVLKQFAEPILFGIEKNCEEYVEAKRLLKFLDYFLGVSSEEIPRNSILREFVGGSAFHV